MRSVTGNSAWTDACRPDVTGSQHRASTGPEDYAEFERGAAAIRGKLSMH